MVLSKSSTSSLPIKENSRQRSARSNSSVKKRTKRKEDPTRESFRENVGQENESDCESDSKIYMSCIIQGQRVGVAYFDATTREMFVMDAWEEGEAEDFPSVQMIKYQIRPEIIFTSTKMDDSFVSALQKGVRQDGEAPNVQLVKSSVFGLHQAKHRLAYLQVKKGMARDLNSMERKHVLNSMINLGNDMQVRAAGGLLAILQQEMLMSDTSGQDPDEDGEPSDQSSRFQIESISELSLNGFLYMDMATHDALQIFQLERHASAMGIGKAKEGFSVFGMMNKCITAMGKRLLRIWFLRPILDLKVLNNRLDAIQILATIPDFVEALQGCLKRLKDVPRLLKKILSPTTMTKSRDWLTLVESMGALWQIRGILDVATAQRSQYQRAFLQLDIVEKVFDLITEDLVHVSDLINGVIDFDQLCGENCDTMIAYDLCEELDDLKRMYEGLPDFLQQVTNSELRRLPAEIRSNGGSIVYIPQVGYLMRFIRTKLERELLDSQPDFEFAFEGNQEEMDLYYRTPKTRELDNDLGDVYHKILDMEQALLRNLEVRVEEYSVSLIQAAKVAAEIDCILSLTIAAREYQYTRPDLTEEDLLVIKNGRHPLQEMTVERYVPNDTEIRSEGRIRIITGPNYSGKSIYARQVKLQC